MKIVHGPGARDTGTYVSMLAAAGGVTLFTERRPRDRGMDDLVDVREVATEEAGASAQAPSTVTDEELATTLRVLRALASADGGPTAEYRKPRFKPLREALQLYVDDVRSRLFHGQGADKYTRRKESKRAANAKAQQEKALDRAAAEKTQMRAERLRMLSGLEQQAGAGMAALPFVPDGAVDTGGAVALPAITHQLEPSAAAGDEATSDEVASVGAGEGSAELRTLRACYTCKARYRTLHHFYAQLCPACAALNYTKREQMATLNGRVFLLTGARVKIGFQAGLRLLRCGATVLATSRFPVDTASRYAVMPDASSWLDRLRVYGLDMRDLAAIECFCAHLLHSEARLDGIINNACQTIRRPAAYYAHLVAPELQPDEWSAPVRTLLQGHIACFGAPTTAMPSAAPTPPSLPPPEVPLLPEVPPPVTTAAPPPAEGMAAAAVASAQAVSALWGPPPAHPAGAVELGGGSKAPSTAPAASRLVPSALWSQAPLWSAQPGVAQPDEGTVEQFPVGVRDVNGQQLDTRRSNSWLLKLHEISTPEAAEVLAINALAPFILNSRLRALLEACPTKPTFIVNVSAMEGKFYRYKTPNHPHTNMAKAALNMMTRTCAEELATVGVLMNSVDTGWINDENPLERAAATAARHHFQTPLDEIDAAARILDPILSTANGGEHVNGKFLKDYRPVEW